MGNDLTVDFSRGGNGIDHCGTGWAEPEPTGVWMLGQQSLLVLPRPEAPGDYRLEMDLGALTGPDHPSQRLAVGVNGTVLGEFMLVSDSVEHCVLPWPVISREPGLTLVLSHPDAWRPSEMTGGEGDQRELSLFLGQLRLVLHEAAPAASPVAPPAAPVPAAQAPIPAKPAVQAPPVQAAPAPAAPAPIPPKPPVQTPPVQAAPAPAAQAPIPAKPPVQTPPVQAAPAPAAPKPAAPPPAAAAPAPAARPAVPAPAPAAQVAPSLQVPASRPTPAPAATRPAAPAQEARVPWWKKLLG